MSDDHLWMHGSPEKEQQRFARLLVDYYVGGMTFMALARKHGVLIAGLGVYCKRLKV